MLIPQDIIAKKRDGGELSRDEVNQFVEGVVSGAFRDYQASALLMAIVLQGMTVAETRYLTEAMMRSGHVLELTEIKRPKVDKHSTGGVGDKVSLILGPLAAALGLCIPMISGRGLGHTGGTLDKLESISGFQTQITDAAYRAQLDSVHLAIVGQSAEMVPADRLLYALRDVTGTVESIPLITSSILSKKLAAGIEALVLDVKCGSGAFMKTPESARALADSLVETCHAMNMPCTAFITRMEEPLGSTVGNAIEVLEAIECLSGNGPKDLMDVTNALVTEMLRMGQLIHSPPEALAKINSVIQDGSALQAFADMVQAQGGDPRQILEPDTIQLAGEILEVTVPDGSAGYVKTLEARSVGEAARLLGAGRTHADEVIDLTVGIRLHKKTGDAIQPGDRLATIYYNDSGKLLAAQQKLLGAYQFSTTQPVLSNSILDHISNPLVS